MAGNVGQGQGPFYGQPYVSRRGPGQDVETRLTQVDNFSKQTEMSLNLEESIYTGCPKKKCDLCLNAHRGLQKGATDKSLVRFEKFRKFPVQ